MRFLYYIFILLFLVFSANSIADTGQANTNEETQIPVNKDNTLQAVSGLSFRGENFEQGTHGVKTKKIKKLSPSEKNIKEYKPSVPKVAGAYNYDKLHSDKHYVGLALGNTNIESDISDNKGGDLDKKDVSVRLLYGYNLSERFAVEAFWTNLGKAELSGDSSGSQFKFDDLAVSALSKFSVKAKSQAYGVGAILSLIANPRLFTQIKLGIQANKTEYSSSGNFINTNTEASVKIDETKKSVGLYGGLNIEYDFDEDLAVRGEALVYDIAGNTVSDFSISLLGRF